VGKAIRGRQNWKDSGMLRHPGTDRPRLRSSERSSGTCPRRLFAPLALVAGLLGVAACGGSSPERDAARQLESALEQLSDQGVDVDLGGLGGEGGISIDLGEGGMSMGQNLPRPDWLPSGFPLPDGLNISYALNDMGSGEAGLGGSVPGDVAAVRAEVVGAMERYGARLLQDEPGAVEALTFLLADETAVYAVFFDQGDGTTQLTYTFTSDADVEQLEFLASGPRTGPGSAVAVIDADVFRSEGTCEIGPNFAIFFSTGDPDEPQISLQVDATGTETIANGNVTVVTTGGDMRMWLLSNTGQTARFDDTTIVAAGDMLDIMTGDTEIPGSIDVTCR